MKRLFLLILLLFSTGLNAQFSPVWTIPSGYLAFDARAFKMSENGTGIILCTAPYDGSGANTTVAYHTQNFGVSWDTTIFSHESILVGSCFVTPSGKLYLTTVQDTYPPVGVPYQKKIFHRSLDGGISWFSNTIDSVFGSNKEENLKFLNDSVGVFYYGNGMYVTMDYGTTWTNVLQKNLNNVSVSEDGFVAYQNMEAFTYNPYTNQLDSMDYFPYSNGSVSSSNYKDGIHYRGIRSSHGTDFGSSYQYNFASLNLDPLPLGDQAVIHFPQNFALTSIDVTDACLHLVMDGWYVRSCDNASSFNFINGFNSDPNEYLVFLDFINDTVGFAVTINQVLQECKLWKTINGGGSNYLPVNSLHYDISLGILENTSAVSLEVFPNPTSAEITIQSQENIEKIEIYSLEGKLAKTYTPNSTQFIVDLSDLTSGYYNVVVGTSEGRGQSKLIKL